MSELINIDFIGAVTMTDAGKLEHKRVPIQKTFQDRMDEMTAMLQNENRTVLDLQDHFQRFMPKNASSEAYDYVAPYDYQSSFIGFACYPKIISYAEYKSELEAVEHREVESFMSKHGLNKNEQLPQPLQEELKSAIVKAVAWSKKRMKEFFAWDAKRFMNAFWYHQTLMRIRENTQNKMYSTENLGWTAFKYPISDDILFFMKSNFGYGSSSWKTQGRMPPETKFV